VYVCLQSQLHFHWLCNHCLATPPWPVKTAVGISRLSTVWLLVCGWELWVGCLLTLCTHNTTCPTQLLGWVRCPGLQGRLNCCVEACCYALSLQLCTQHFSHTFLSRSRFTHRFLWLCHSSWVHRGPRCQHLILEH